METLLLDREQVAAHAPIDDVIAAVEEAFAAYGRGRAMMPTKSYVDLPEFDGDFRSMPAYLETETWRAAGVKWVNVHPENPDRHDLPTVMGTMLYSDPETGFPLAILDGTELTRRRTAAAAAVATDYLAVEDARTLGIVGAGEQSIAQIEAIATVRPIEAIVVSDPDDDARLSVAERFDDQFDVRSGSAADAGSCDVVSTVTPVREPVLHLEDVADHAHINAIGADAEGKRELGLEILRDALLIIDDAEQCIHSGEINVPWRRERIDDDDVAGTIPELVVGDLDARNRRDRLTVFDSTGLAIQDVAAAHVVYEAAVAAEGGRPLDLFSLESP